MKKANILILILLLLLSSNIKSQIPEDNSKIFFDAVFFKDKIENSVRVDVFILVPYQSLNFFKIKDKYSAKYSCNITITDNNFKIIDTKNYEKSIVEEDYVKSQGGTGAFDYSQSIFTLKKGKYSVKATITDNRNSRVYEKTREINLIDFSEYDFSLSSILLLSNIEENNGKYKITPHISDDISDLKEGYFAFFEIYSQSIGQNVYFDYEISKQDDKIIAKGTKSKINIANNTTRHFLKVKTPNNITEGIYKLKIYAFKENNDSIPGENDIIAIAERSIKYQRTFAGLVLKELDKSIKQMSYVANQREIDYIESGANIEQKQARFEEFWKNLDPTPNTDRNEAFEEYYGRIDFANRNFKSHLEGWRSDKGNVYVVYGAPYNVDRYGQNSGSRTYETWIYRNNKQFTFVDNNGFGDFRLYSPLSVSEKYKWE